ncbi:RrF2 family transcriptional regulator [Chlorogloeopsis fritschii PCC 9212]|uniref:Rrf2 family transcriptional regulator n=1 Tax=Chlorogloeopsis fritschii PCC 6912 TaxID=211165 RepID=A0A3S1AJQ1_CHLFR|nr:Rrf2 family transcriptional regulator [Chlorogloeopsis fritschii]MBF2005788.1 Rrf2 family transcriptional regulator [Chlorogloeopsis fritschii C42_A2020_084]RUR81912.1 Rrf2 family transcriptional regulator [Chlorogloeopsis fritschii PCC 6912]
MNESLRKQKYALLDLSAKVEYALIALLELANNCDRKTPVTMSDISAKHPIPERYLEQILTSLRRSGVVQSQRGSKGGFVLLREPRQLTLLEVVIMLDGEQKEKESLGEENLEKILVHNIWQQADLAAQDVLSQYTIQDLFEQREARLQKSQMYYI